MSVLQYVTDEIVKVKKPRQHSTWYLECRYSNEPAGGSDKIGTQMLTYGKNAGTCYFSRMSTRLVSAMITNKPTTTKNIRPVLERIRRSFRFRFLHPSISLLIPLCYLSRYSLCQLFARKIEPAVSSDDRDFNYDNKKIQVKAIMINK